MAASPTLTLRPNTLKDMSANTWVGSDLIRGVNLISGISLVERKIKKDFPVLDIRAKPGEPLVGSKVGSPAPGGCPGPDIHN